MGYLERVVVCVWKGGRGRPGVVVASRVTGDDGDCPKVRWVAFFEGESHGLRESAQSRGSLKIATYRSITTGPRDYHRLAGGDIGRYLSEGNLRSGLSERASKEGGADRENSREVHSGNETDEVLLLQGW